MPVKKADKLVIPVFGEMCDALAKGERAEIRGFGSFKIKHYDAYVGRNPKTLKTIEVRPKKAPFFKCGLEHRSESLRNIVGRLKSSDQVDRNSRTRAKGMPEVL